MSVTPGPGDDDLRWTVGDATITRVAELDLEFKPEFLFDTATPEAVTAHADWLQPHFLTERGRLRFAFQGFVVESRGRLIVVDTCLGEHEWVQPQGGSRYLAELDRLGYPRESVDVVLCTHLHHDHVGWNTMSVDGELVPTFPNARYLFGRVEYAHWKNEVDGGLDEEILENFDESTRPIVEAGLCDFVAVDHVITPEVRLVATPGHSPGHASVLVESRGQRALITGDIVHHPIQWAEVEWSLGADTDPELAVATRRRVLDEFADGRTLVIGSHFASPCAGHLRSREGGHVYDATDPHPLP